MMLLYSTRNCFIMARSFPTTHVLLKRFAITIGVMDPLEMSCINFLNFRRFQLNSKAYRISLLSLPTSGSCVKLPCFRIASAMPKKSLLCAEKIRNHHRCDGSIGNVTYQLLESWTIPIKFQSISYILVILIYVEELC